MIRGLSLALSKGVTEVTVHCDNLVIVNQILGDYTVNSPALKEKFDIIHQLLPRFNDYKFIWVPREQNKQADGLASRAIERKRRSQGRY